MLVEDPTGKGHDFRVMGSDKLLTAVVQLPPADLTGEGGGELAETPFGALALGAVGHVLGMTMLTGDEETLPRDCVAEFSSGAFIC